MTLSGYFMSNSVFVLAVSTFRLLIVFRGYLFVNLEIMLALLYRTVSRRLFSDPEMRNMLSDL